MSINNIYALCAKISAIAQELEEGLRSLHQGDIARLKKLFEEHVSALRTEAWTTLAFGAVSGIGQMATGFIPNANAQRIGEIFFKTVVPGVDKVTNTLQWSERQRLQQAIQLEEQLLRETVETAEKHGRTVEQMMHHYRELQSSNAQAFNNLTTKA